MRFDTNALPLAKETDFEGFRNRLEFLGFSGDERVAFEIYSRFQNVAQFDGHLTNDELRSLVKQATGIQL